MRIFSTFRAVLAVVGVWCAAAPSLPAQRQMEPLGRGMLVQRTSSTQAYVSWRLLGHEPAATGFNIYRSTAGGTAVKLNASPVTQTTDFLDNAGSAALAGPNSYVVRPVVGGIEGPAGAAFVLPTNAPVRQYLAIPKTPVASGSYGLGQTYPADVDGDGEFELICRLDFLGTGTPADGRFIFDCYKLNGSHLWRVRGGPNLLNSNDGDGFLNAADYDGDGRAEIALRTTAGTVFANGSTITDTSSQEFLSILNGQTGVEMARVPFKPALGPDYFTYWGANMRPFYLYMASAWLDGVRPSLITCRGIGGNRLHIHAWDFRNGTLTERWSWIATDTQQMATGHNMLVFDIDNDQKDEIVFIGGAIDDNGTYLYSTGLGHGDHIRFADLDPDRPGYECYAIQQDSALGAMLYDGLTGRSLRKWYLNTPGDPSRADAADVDANFRGMELWSIMPNIWTCKGELIGSKSIFPARGLWWDRDLQREILSGAGSSMTAPVVNKINASHQETRLYSIYNEGVTQGFGGFPPFSGDLLGDWREEIVLESSDRAEIRVYATRIPAENRFYALMQNPAYRASATCKGRTGGMFTDYYLGSGMEAVPPPPMVRADLVWKGGSASNAWDVNGVANWQNNGASLKFQQGQSVLFDLTGSNSPAVQLTGTLTPAAVTVHSPKSYTFAGAGTLGGSMPLVKAGAGSLTLSGNHGFRGATTVWDGALVVNGQLSQSPVTVHGGTWGGALAGGMTGGRLAGSGTVGQGVTLRYGAAITPGNGMGHAGTLRIQGGLTQTQASVLALDLSDDPSGTLKPNDRLEIQGNLLLSGTSTIFIKPLNGALAPGTYTLVTYSGALGGGLENLQLAGLPGVPAFLANPPGAITLVVPSTRAAASIVWTGAENGSWDLARSQNWQRGGAADVFVPGDAVRFDDSAGANRTVNLGEVATTASVTVEGTGNYQIEGSGGIAGAGGLTKNGTGTLTLLTRNSYGGATQINGGVLEVADLSESGEPGPLGAAASSVQINGGTLRLLARGGAFTNRGVAIGAAGATLEVQGAGDGLTIGGVVSGSGALAKTGPGTLQFLTANTHAGGIRIEGGTVSLGNTAANRDGPGSGPVTFINGTLKMADIESSVSANWNMVVPGGGSGRLNADGRCSLRGSLTGSGSFTVYGPYVRTDLHGNWSQFSGSLHLLGDLRVANPFGYGNAAVSMGDSTFYYINTVPAGGVMLDIGSLSGVAEARLRGAATATNVLTWRVGRLNTDATFAGNIEEQNPTSVTAIDKVGTGTWTLSGTNTYRGATTVSAGKLLLTGSLSGGNVTVRNAATLENRGGITGNVTIEAGGTLAPAGTITGNLTNHGTVRVTGDDLLAVSGTFTNYGVLDLGTWSGTLPANFINHGTIVSAPLPQVAIVSPAAEAVRLAFPSAGLELRATAAAGASHQWRVVSGPGAVTFDDPAALATTARFTTPGAYELEITATNPSGQASARRAVLVGDNQTLTFREGESGYTHIAALIRADNPTWNSGVRDQLIVGRTSGDVRSVLSFNLPVLPASAVSSVHLDLWAQAAGSVADLRLHPLTGVMTEGSGTTGSATGDGVTWNSRNGLTNPADLWTAAGGDFNGAVLCAEIAPAGGITAAANANLRLASTAAFVTTVKSALQTGQPLGLLLRSVATTTNNQFLRIISDEHPTVAMRPLLTIGLAAPALATVHAGSAPAATEGVPAALAGTTTGSALWSLVSGPGTVVFANPAQAATSVTFSQPGRHVLRLSGSDANGTTSADLTVEVNANPQAAGAVAEVDQFGSVEIPLPASDPDGDPVSIVSVSQGAQGSVTLLAGGIAQYSATGFVGDDSFTYAVGDGRGGVATGTVTVTVRDITPPVIAPPAMVVVEATSVAGAVVAFSASATDAASGDCPVTSDPPNGSVFPLGDTTVTLTAADASGNSSSATFVVRVRDTTPPVISGPADFAVPATSTGGAVVTFETGAVDAVSGVLVSNNQPTSGSLFPVGATLVTTSASDAAGNAASRTFTVTVTATPEVRITSPAVDSASIPSIESTVLCTAVVDSLFPATVVWSKVSGPGEVVFETSGSRVTEARFSANGTYVIECAATSEAGTARARRTVLVGGAQQLTFRQGENGYAHIAALIRSDFRTWNSGARDQMLVGKTSGGHPLRTVLSFPLHGIPAGATVTSARLDVWTNTEQGPGTVDALELRPLRGTLVEGTGTSSSDSNNGAGTGVTWNSRTGQTSPPDLWSTPGGDYQASVLSTIAGFDARIAQQQRTFANTPAFRDAVAAALTENQALGLMIVSPATELGASNRFTRLASDDSALPGLRPRLTVGFEGSPLPLADAGTAPSAVSGVAAALTGTVSNAAGALWEQLSGPGTAVFSDPLQPACLVTFDRAGEYRLRLSAANAAGRVADELVVAVAANPAVLADWQELHWPGVADPGVTGPQADPDGDGLVNLVEFALFLGPKVPDRSPVELLVAEDGLRFTYRRARHAQGVRCQVEWSDSLLDGSWSQAGVVESVVVPDDDPDREWIRAVVPPGDEGRRFVRLRVSRP